MSTPLVIKLIVSAPIGQDRSPGRTMSCGRHPAPTRSARIRPESGFGRYNGIIASLRRTHRPDRLACLRSRLNSTRTRSLLPRASMRTQRSPTQDSVKAMQDKAASLAVHAAGSRTRRGCRCAAGAPPADAILHSKGRARAARRPKRCMRCLLPLPASNEWGNRSRTSSKDPA